MIKEISSLYNFKKRIKRKYKHDLKFLKIDSYIGTFRSEISTDKDYFHRTYVFKCITCGIIINLYDGTFFNIKDPSFNIKDRYCIFRNNSNVYNVDFNKCNEYLIKSILE